MAKKEQIEEMTTEEAKAARAAKHAAIPKKPTDQEQREAFRIFWAQEKSKYGKDRKLEPVLWVHLKAIGMASPDKFNAGIQHFGLKQVSK